MSIIHRLGCFFLMVGGLVFILFLATDMSRAPQFDALWISLPILGIGFYLWRKGRPKAKPSGRFRLLNKMRTRDKITPEERRHGS
jgi:hypothetical protein